MIYIYIYCKIAISQSGFFNSDIALSLTERKYYIHTILYSEDRTYVFEIAFFAPIYLKAYSNGN